MNLRWEGTSSDPKKRGQGSGGGGEDWYVLLDSGPHKTFLLFFLYVCVCVCVCGHDGHIFNYAFAKLIFVIKLQVVMQAVFLGTISSCPSIVTTPIYAMK